MICLFLLINLNKRRNAWIRLFDENLKFTYDHSAAIVTVTCPWGFRCSFYYITNHGYLCKNSQTVWSWNPRRTGRTEAGAKSTPISSGLVVVLWSVWLTRPEAVDLDQSIGLQQIRQRTELHHHKSIHVLTCVGHDNDVVFIHREYIHEASGQIAEQLIYALWFVHSWNNLLTLVLSSK